MDADGPCFCSSSLGRLYLVRSPGEPDRERSVEIVDTEIDEREDRDLGRLED
jgi:hypothetical protein